MTILHRQGMMGMNASDPFMTNSVVRVLLPRRVVYWVSLHLRADEHLLLNTERERDYMKMVMQDQVMPHLNSHRSDLCEVDIQQYQTDFGYRQISIMVQQIVPITEQRALAVPWIPVNLSLEELHKLYP